MVTSQVEFGLKAIGFSAVVVLSWACLSWSQEGAEGDSVLLELRQLRSEVDFLRNQVETGGGVADVRFDDLQRRIDKVLEDAAALATEASTAKRQAETAVSRVLALEEQLSVMQAGVDVLATRLASLESDTIFGQTEEATPDEGESAAANAESPSSSLVVGALSDEDGVSVPLPKDRAERLPPTREVTTEVRVADETAEVIALPISSPGLIAMPDARPLNGDLPVFPEARPQSPIRTISPGALPAEEPAQTTQEGPELAGTFVDLDPVTTASSARSSEALSGFEDSRAAFATGDFARVVMNLQEIVAAGDLGPRAPEGYYMLGVAYLRQDRYPTAIQTLAIGLRQYSTSPFAGPSLVSLADALNANGQTTESCRLLSFVPIEYPNDKQAVTDAEQRTGQFGC